MSRTSVWHLLSCALLFCALAGFSPLAALAAPITIDTVPVGNPGNAADPSTGNLYGSVSYDYRIGVTEVTNAQYAEFLNAKAASDPFALYSTFMDQWAHGGITRSGVSGSFTYATKANMGDKPVIFVSWHDAVRFANWLTNGQAGGDTETGSYTITNGGANSGSVAVPTVSQRAILAGGGKRYWFLPSEDEWYKAAYHQPAAQGGDSDDYWLYPTASNSEPTMATANSVGDISNPGANVANYNLGADWNSQNGNVTTVGSAGPLSHSFYGTADQGGNVWEWNEFVGNAQFRGQRGGSFTNFASDLQSSLRRNWSGDFGAFGFRLALIPEPSTAVLATVGCVLMLWWSKRRK